MNYDIKEQTFFRQGKVKALGIICNSSKYVDFFRSLGLMESNVDVGIASEFVSNLYGFGTDKDVNEVRHKKLIAMTGKIAQVNLLN